MKSIGLRRFLTIYLQIPINDYTAAAGFIGIKPTTNKSHIIRSLLESIVFGIMQLFYVLGEETNFTHQKIRLAKNSFEFL